MYISFIFLHCIHVSWYETHNICHYFVNNCTNLYLLCSSKTHLFHNNYMFLTGFNLMDICCVYFCIFVWCNVEYKSLLQLYLGYMTWFSLPLWGTSELPIYSKSQKKMLPVFFSSKIKPYYHAPKMVKNITKNASMCMMAKLCTATAHFAALFAIKGDITSFQTVSTIKTSETTW